MEKQELKNFKGMPIEANDKVCIVLKNQSDIDIVLEALTKLNVTVESFNCVDDLVCTDVVEKGILQYLSKSKFPDSEEDINWAVAEFRNLIRSAFIEKDISLIDENNIVEAAVNTFFDAYIKSYNEGHKQGRKDYMKKNVFKLIK